MSDEMEFFIYLLESYAEYKNKSTGECLSEWIDKDLVQKIYDGYWAYHTESIENAFHDIDSLVNTGKHFW